MLEHSRPHSLGQKGGRSGSSTEDFYPECFPDKNHVRILRKYKIQAHRVVLQRQGLGNMYFFLFFQQARLHCQQKSVGKSRLSQETRTCFIHTFVASPPRNPYTLKDTHTLR